MANKSDAASNNYYILLQCNALKMRYFWNFLYIFLKGNKNIKTTICDLIIHAPKG